MYYRTDKPYEDQGGNYELITTGAGIRFGVPFSETDTVSSGCAGADTHQVRHQHSRSLSGYADRYGASSSAVPLTIGWSRDGRDSALAPNAGRYQRLNTDWSVAGDARYVRANYQYQQYVP